MIPQNSEETGFVVPSGISKDALRKAISDALISAGVDDLQIELDVCDAVWGLVKGEGIGRVGTAKALEEGASLDAKIRSDVERLFRITPNWNTKTWSDTCIFLKNRHSSGETLDLFATWWYTNDWRGKQGQPPPANVLRELWPQAFASSASPIEEQASFKLNLDGSFN